MKVLVEIIFCLSALAMLHTYILYPVFILFVAPRKKKIQTVTSNDLPEITILCAAYNEEKVIEQKIRSTFNTQYPLEKLTLIIGTDNCSDNTVSLIKDLQKKYSGLKLEEFTARTGKIGILNTLMHEAKGSILVMTDANVYFTPETIPQLIAPFTNALVGMVCAQVIKRPLNKEVVTQSELQYMNFENRLKSAESETMELVMGAEGGCYGVRKKLLKEIPRHFNADDFFVTCLVLRSHSKIVFQKEALAYEDVAADTKGEFRRKARIATGNFQNLFYFKDLLSRFWTATAFAFASHKVLRWITPFLFLLNVAAAALLFKTHFIFQVILYAQLALVILPFLNSLLVSAGLRFKPFIALTHFMVMNAALAVGFLRYCRGVKSSVWEPVKR